MSKELAAYISEYINEEWLRKGEQVAKDLGLFEHHRFVSLLYARTVDTDMILKAVDAYEGGAR